ARWRRRFECGALNSISMRTGFAIRAEPTRSVLTLDITWAETLITTCTFGGRSLQESCDSLRRKKGEERRKRIRWQIPTDEETYEIRRVCTDQEDRRGQHA